MVVVAVAFATWVVIAALVAWRISARSLSRMERQMAEERAQLEALALEDPVTGLPNKRAFEDRLDGELRRAGREFYPVSVVALKVEPAADETLVTFARHLRAQLRASDTCGHVGGDKFLLTLVRADAEAADHVLARMRTALGDETIRFSAGIAEFPRHASTRPQLMQGADGALSQAKSRSGSTAIYSPPGANGAQSARRPLGEAGQRGLQSTLTELARTVDSKSRYTVGHSERVAVYAVDLGRNLGFSEDRLHALRQAALLHDVGKVGIRETILMKEGALNLEEQEEMQRHSELGRAMLLGAGMHEIARWVNHLHERFDGHGYPSGLVGNDIPVESRILHVADALDHMVQPNSIRRDRPVREALGELSYCSGRSIDPEIAARAIELVHSGELKLVGHDPKRVSRQTLAPRMG
jgi:diguanylate cyclase (GGDEF)-like protein